MSIPANKIDLCSLLHLQGDHFNLTIFSGTLKKRLVQCTRVQRRTLNSEYVTLYKNRKTQPCLISHPVWLGIARV